MVPRSILVLLSFPLLCGCSQSPKQANIPEIYQEAASEIGDDRNPVIVLPGILGSKLEEPSTGKQVWGAFVYGAADADTASGARLIALPMREGVPLSDLRDDIVAYEVLDTLQVDVGLFARAEVEAYADILTTLAAGDYRDSTLGESGALMYPDDHYTCFQFPYDWRRDIGEQAVQLHEFIVAAQEISAERRGTDDPVKVDVVAHSMGGLVLRYYLRHGPTPLPEDGSLPPLTWEGAQRVEHAILIGTPNAGSVLALKQLVEGVSFAALITPTYRAALLGTMPAIYQLMPRTRHARVIDEETGDPVNLLDPRVWERYGWGLADPDQDRVLRQLLPDVGSREERRRIALDHLDKCLSRTRQFFDAMDAPASPPDGCSIFLIAGDAIPTANEVTVDRRGRLKVTGTAPGDDTVTRVSATMDERVGTGYKPFLRSPIGWRSVQFLPATHIGLTSHPTFTNFLLFVLLEMPRQNSTGENGGQARADGSAG